MTDIDAGAASDASPGRIRRQRECVDVFIDLVLDGSYSIAPEEVADRAGVSRATFFRYFSTLDELRNAAAHRTMERFAELLTLSDLEGGTREDRVSAFVSSRVRMYETLHPLMVLMRSHAVTDKGSAEFVSAGRHVFVHRVRHYFEPDLRHYTPAVREDSAISIAALTSVESWLQFRRSYNRSPAQTKRAWRNVILAILADPGGDRSGGDGPVEV